MKTKVIGYYSIFLFIAVTGYWFKTLLSGAYSEGKIEISFHIFSELLMASICLISGILLIMKNHLGRVLNIVGLSMVIYSVLNAAGYFGEKNNLSMMAMFFALFVITMIALVAQIRHK